VSSPLRIDADLQRATSGSAVAPALSAALRTGKSSITRSAQRTSGRALSPSRPAVNTTSTCRANRLDRARRRPPQDRRRPRRQNHGVSALNDFFSLASRAWTDAHGGDSTTIKLTEIPMSQAGAAVITAHRRSDRRAAYYQSRCRSKIRVIVTLERIGRTSCIHLVHVGRFRGQTSRYGRALHARDA